MNTFKTELTATILNELAHECNNRSEAAGWNIDPVTKEKIPPHYYVPLKLALAHSELSEALEGFRKNLLDDHLQKRSMLEVELADAIIRIVQMAAYLDLDIGGAVIEKLEYNSKRADHKIENRVKDNGKRF